MTNQPARTKVREASISLHISRLLVGLVFAATGAAFIWETYALFAEFGMEAAMPIMALDSQNFLFFPLFGLVALMAFWRITSLVVDDAWHSGILGLVALIVAVAAIVAGGVSFANSMKSETVRSIWEVAPDSLVGDAADRGVPSGCTPPNCERAPVFDALQALRIEAQRPEGLGPYVLSCADRDQSIFAPQTPETEAFCFATGNVMTEAACCMAKEKFRDDVAALSNANESDLTRVHEIVMPIKATFFIALLVTGVLLMLRASSIHSRYPERARIAESTIVVGAIAMLIWPIMNLAFARNITLLFGGGSAYRAVGPLITFGFIAWALTIVGYYVRRHRPRLDNAARIAGGLAAVVGVLNYETVLDVTTQYAGAGASLVSLTALGIVTGFLAVQVTSAWAGNSNSSASDQSAAQGGDDDGDLDDLLDVFE